VAHPRLIEADRPVFFLSFGSPWSYLAAERVNAILPVVPVWQPVSERALGTVGESRPALDPAEREAVERLATERGLPPVRWPPDREPDAGPSAALLAAIYAQGVGRVVAFTLAALRQAFAAGRDLREVDTMLLAAAACELHPRAVLKGIESRAVKERLDAANRMARELGVERLPAVAAGGTVFYGDQALEEAAAAIGDA
jgi:2-hydroxychromene-2-carboxylate isomerase